MIAALQQGERMLFGSDVQARLRLFGERSFGHPAKLHLGLLGWIIERYTQEGDVIADPMAGSGSVLMAATMGRAVIAREVEPKWVDFMREAATRIQCQQMFVGGMDIAQADAREPWGFECDAVIFSPPYGCDAAKGDQRKGILSPKTRKLVAAGLLQGDWIRLATATNTGQAASYLFWYGQHEAQVGHLRGGRYWQEMTRIYEQAHAALRGGGYMVLVIKDHIKGGQRVHVADQTVRLCEGLGFRLAERHEREVYPLSLWQRRRKERGEPVVETEDVIALVEEGMTA